MQIFQKQIRAQIDKTEEMLERIRQFQTNMPKGTLKIVKKDKIAYYHWQYTDENQQRVTKYIPKKEMNRIRALAQKGYYEKAAPVLQKNLKLLKAFDEAYCYDRGMHVYDTMTEERKALLLPLEEGRVRRLHAWQTETYEPCGRHLENLRYETNQGELVRSKSEVIIANQLHQYSDRMLYKYERPLTLQYQGNPITFYPDFTILNIETGKITYWEHAGLMSNSGYASDFVRKNSVYNENNLFQGENVIYTYEAEEHPLEIRVVKQIVRRLAEG